VNDKNGTNSAQAFSHSLTIPGYFCSETFGKVGQPLKGSGLSRGRVDRLEVLGDY
jgi:hypothetical protein